MCCLAGADGATALVPPAVTTVTPETSSGGSNWLTEIVPISAISLILLGMAIGIASCTARFLETCHSRVSINDDDSDMSEHTRVLLKRQLKQLFPERQGEGKSDPEKAEKAAKKLMGNWRKNRLSQRSAASNQGSKLRTLSEQVGKGTAADSVKDTEKSQNSTSLVESLTEDKTKQDANSNNKEVTLTPVDLDSYMAKKAVKKQDISLKKDQKEEEFIDIELQPVKREAEPKESQSESPKKASETKLHVPPLAVHQNTAVVNQTALKGDQLDNVSSRSSVGEFSVDSIPGALLPEKDTTQSGERASSNKTDPKKGQTMHKYVRPMTRAGEGAPAPPLPPQRGAWREATLRPVSGKGRGAVISTDNKPETVGPPRPPTAKSRSGTSKGGEGLRGLSRPITAGQRDRTANTTANPRIS